MTTYKNMLKTYYWKIHNETDAYLGESATGTQNAVYDRLTKLVYGPDGLPF
jgi:hypothetical protein